MKPINPRICLALAEAVVGRPLEDAEKKQLAALSTRIFEGRPVRGTETGRMIIPKGEAGRTPEPWEYDKTLTGLAPLQAEVDYDAVEEQAADILLTDLAPNKRRLGKVQIVQHGPDARF